ncbi:hypothetical protein [Treponema denticola]|uniref:hypothetical protein n=1 Tax=Treponema denticola TaxID=158 RepID=UPI0020A48F2A|nr:hypothetical protein [Treponema denticola]UTC83875.1 hypothetical protein HGJ18_12015 [Treponema denticola]
MDTDVYVFCKTCNEITEGVGSGDPRDSITCNCCKTMITSNVVGNFKPLGTKKELRLYWPE